MTHIRILFLTLLAASAAQAAQITTLKNGFTLEASLQQSQGDVGFEIGDDVEVISKLNYELDGTLINFTGSGPLGLLPGLSYRIHYAASISMDGDSLDLDWENGVLSDRSVSESEIDVSLWGAELLYEFKTTDTSRLGALIGYHYRSFDIETSNAQTFFSEGVNVDFFDEGPVSTYDVEFTSFDLGLYANWLLSERISLQTELSWSPFLEAESEAFWILRNYPFEQSAEGMSFSASAKATYSLTDSTSAILGVSYVDLTADDDGLESGIADGVEPYFDEPIVPEITADYVLIEIGILFTF